MSNMSSSMNTLLVLDEFVSRYCLGALFILGVISITLNTVIFTRKVFKNTSCILYFLASTFANYPIVYFVIPCRLLADGFNLDPTRTNLSFCKFREYVLTDTRSLSAWFIVLASFDRLMSSSRDVNRRQFCHIHIARNMIVLTTVVSLLFYIHIPILFENRSVKNQCEAPTGIYRIINDCIYSICYIIIPAFLMLIFGLLTINNGERRNMTATSSSLNLIKRDRSLFLMIIFQILLFTITTLPHAAQKLYITMTIDGARSDPYQTVVNNFLTHAARMVSFINHSCQFYIFTLSSKLFRQELKAFFYELFGMTHRNRERTNNSNYNRE